MTSAPTIGATMGRALLVAAVVAATLLGLPAAAGAQERPYPPRPEIRVENPAVTVIIRGDDWGPGTTVEIERRNRVSTQSQGEVLAVTQVDDDGSFTAEVPLPAGTDETEVQARGVDASGDERLEDYVVSASPPSATRSSLAQSGLARWQALAGVAAALILLGAASKVLERRREPARASAD